jgi:hypothetical protein
MTTMQKHAASTIAISVYNLLARRGRPLNDIDELTETLAHMQHPELDTDTVQKAVDELQERKLLVLRNGKLDVSDPQRRIIVNRDRDDGYIDDDGIIQGGWDNWQIMDLVRGIVPMEIM